MREGGRACPTAPCRAAFVFSVKGKHKDNFKSRRYPIYVNVKPRPTLTMPTTRQTRLYVNRTRILTVVVPPAARGDGAAAADAGAGGAGEDADTSDSMTLTLERTAAASAFGGGGGSGAGGDALPRDAVTVSPSTPVPVPRSGGVFKFNVTAAGIGSFHLGATLRGGGLFIS